MHCVYFEILSKIYFVKICLIQIEEFQSRISSRFILKSYQNKSFNNDYIFIITIIVIKEKIICSFYQEKDIFHKIDVLNSLIMVPLIYSKVKNSYTYLTIKFIN